MSLLSEVSKETYNLYYRSRKRIGTLFSMCMYSKKLPQNNIHKVTNKNIYKNMKNKSIYLGYTLSMEYISTHDESHLPISKHNMKNCDFLAHKNRRI